MNLYMEQAKAEAEEMENDALTYEYRITLLPKDSLSLVNKRRYVDTDSAKRIMVSSMIKGYNDAVKFLLEELHKNCEGHCETCPLMNLAYNLCEYDGEDCPDDIIPKYFGML